MLNPDAFKKAAIDWLLTNGECNSMTDSTALALADLSVNGIDYEATEAPDFDNVAIKPGDTFHEATWGEAFTTTVYPLKPDAPKESWQRYDGHTFFMGHDDLMKVLLSNMIKGLIEAAEVGDTAWKARANQREVERLTRNRDAEAERARRLEEARAQRKAKTVASEKAGSTNDLPKGKS